ncbi:DUF885 family protein, partial [Salmonella enterica]|uniref:DUF885 family protein n=1 Tax=Salmonella enterica TaxID=28901 RepID=UPI0010924028
PTAAAETLEPLTEREEEVLQCLAKGMSNAEIAKALIVSEGTVKAHLGRMMSKWHLRDLNVIASAAQDVRSAFDLMPTATVEDWEVISTRLSAVPAALRGYVETLRLGIAEGVTPARRQVAEVATQIDR